MQTCYSFQIITLSPSQCGHNSADQTILLVPNIRRAMVEYHDILWDLGCKFFILSQSCCEVIVHVCTFKPTSSFLIYYFLCALHCLQLFVPTYRCNYVRRCLSLERSLV